jgi:hypothetical protein
MLPTSEGSSYLVRKQLDSLVLPLMDHRSLWLRVDGGGKSEYRRTENFCSHASTGAKQGSCFIRERHIGVWLYFEIIYLIQPDIFKRCCENSIYLHPS